MANNPVEILLPCLNNPTLAGQYRMGVSRSCRLTDMGVYGSSVLPSDKSCISYLKTLLSPPLPNP